MSDGKQFSQTAKIGTPASATIRPEALQMFRDGTVTAGVPMKTLPMVPSAHSFPPSSAVTLHLPPRCFDIS